MPPGKRGRKRCRGATASSSPGFSVVQFNVCFLRVPTAERDNVQEDNWTVYMVVWFKSLI